ncbi:hypothetical protein [Stenotrophomonas sp. 278]|uniref:hypothetical protein n=1 Tax=Stenotrophomonas sp. 278 TaxID=2479851 RepID=UPI001639757D|nr:hypothetical protein [Stenotrophomonas sp. 278]
MNAEPSAKGLAAGRDKADAAAQAGRLGKASAAVSARRKAVRAGFSVHGTLCSLSCD